MMCGADLGAAPPPVSVIAPRRRLPWVPIVLASALFGIALAAGGLWLARAGNPLAPPSATAGTPATAVAVTTATPGATGTPEPTPTRAATATYTASPAPTPTPLRYTVQSGDTLLELAERFDVSVEAIRAANGLEDDTLIAGQELVIPQPTRTPAAPADATADPAASPGTFIHVVQPGETLSGIAEKYGVSMERIQELNNISDPDSLAPGDRLQIPLGTATPTRSPTPGPTATATQRPAYEAPALLAPPDGAAYVLSPQGERQYPADDAIVLQWTSVGLLGMSPPDPANEWYRLRVTNETTGAEPLIFYTRATAWRLSPELRPPSGGTFRFSWDVQVVREIGQLPDGTLQTTANGRPSRVRAFTWEGPLPTPSP
jgi:LysM repeat protein